ncbi:MAG: ComF family protein [Candidatus Moranbacteria bacterium]|nr:ComF family protein [Candidatus Moranbacteria bacterium]
MLAKIKKFILDTLFPVSCLSCGKPDEWICEECFSKIPSLRDQVCPWCEKIPTPEGRVCFACRKKSSLDGLLVASSYQNKLVAAAVHHYKYHFLENLSLPLGRILIQAILDSGSPLPDMIVPVPLHPRRLRWRGFNQAGLLADYLSSNLTPGFAIPVFNNLIVRQRYTPPQMKIKNYSRRNKNIENAFGINKKEYGKKFLESKHILLVDDIATTGATLFECASVLKKAGAKVVFATVIARQEYSKK